MVSYSFFVSNLLLSCYLLFWFIDLCKGRAPIKVICDVLIIDSAIVSGHVQCFVTQQGLQCECIAAAVYQILAGKGMPEQMQTGFFDTAPPIVLCHSRPQSIFCQHFSKLVTEQILRGFAASDRHVVQQNIDHDAAQRNSLNSSVLRMSEHDLSGLEIHISDLNIADGCCSAAAVQKEVYDCPVAEFHKITICFWLLQQPLQFFVCIGCFDCFLVFDVWQR